MHFRGTVGTATAISRLHNYSPLSSLTVSLGNLATESFEQLQLVAHSCARLRKLSVDITPGTEREELFSPLRWKSGVSKPLELESLRIAGFNIRMPTQCPIVDDLSVMTNEHRLRDLTIEAVCYLPNIACTRLKTLRVSMLDDRVDEINDCLRMAKLLRACNGLKELDLSGFGVLAQESLLSQPQDQVFGEFLTKLKLHEYERSTGIQQRPVLDRAMISQLAAQCPRLTTLTVDVAYEADWVCYIPRAVLDRIELTSLLQALPGIARASKVLLVSP